MRTTLDATLERPNWRGSATALPCSGNTLDAGAAHCDAKPMSAPVRLDVEVVSSPLGPITVIERNGSVFAIEFAHASLEDLRVRCAERLGQAVELVRTKLRTATELDEYFRGSRKRFDVRIDLTGIDGFRKSCLTALARVPFGRLVTYGELAMRAGQPKASRAVGGAMGKNPIPIIVPCHRVVAADGTLGGFSSGLSIKRKLHAHEGIARLEGGWKTSKRPRRTVHATR